MPSYHCGLSSTALLLAATLGFSQPAGDTRTTARTDLDTVSDADLRKYIKGELDDIFSNGNANVPLSVCVLSDEIMDAVSDDGDAGDADGLDDFIDESELDDEMEENGSSVEDEVDEALDAEECEDGGSAAVAHGPSVDAQSDGGLPPKLTRTTTVIKVTSKLLQEIRANSKKPE